MNLEKNRTVLKSIGIIYTVFGGLLTALFLFGLIVNLSKLYTIDHAGRNVFLYLIGLPTVIIFLISGLLYIKGARNVSKIKPAWCISLIFFLFSIGMIIRDIIMFRSSYTLSSIFSIEGCFLISIIYIPAIMNIIAFLAANTIRKSLKK